MLSQVPGIVWVVVGVGLAIATPWMIFIALDRQGRDRTGQVFQASIDSVRHALRGEAQDIDELSRRVDALKKQDQDQGKPK